MSNPDIPSNAVYKIGLTNACDPDEINVVAAVVHPPVHDRQHYRFDANIDDTLKPVAFIEAERVTYIIRT
ncbi:hypothetical protein IU487_22355 [Nocardia puris]|uniref:hypothetical protein n=1 Tax=Nocardia puris TaxID=208602 RepID=UPI001895CB27|nr:hypothetical protein [Nocardia puris]MBF6213763.1 hypothetical protein [Nocardia puris]